jgi:hypothetical protein
MAGRGRHGNALVTRRGGRTAADSGTHGRRCSGDKQWVSREASCRAPERGSRAVWE